MRRSESTEGQCACKASERSNRPKSFRFLAGLTLLFFAAWQGVEAGEPYSIDVTGGRAVEINHNIEPLKLLSEYNLFRDPQKQIPNDGVVPYDLNTPHFSDYATLHRFVWMPQETSCHYGPHGKIEFPVGAALIITIGYAADLQDPDSPERIVETRLWIRRTDNWIGAQYVWNEDTTEARRSLVGERMEVSWIHSDGQTRHHKYRVPNQNQCVQCHEIGDRIVPLGPVHARYLNKTFLYDEGPQNQLQHWAKIGYLTDLPKSADSIPRVAAWNDASTGDVNARARAYLDMNCSSCHRKDGIAFTSGLDLTLDQNVPVRFGIFKAPVAAGRSAGTGRFVIEPGHPERSILLMRLQSTDPGMRMPVVGRGLMHAEGVELIKQWISEMEYPEMTAQQQRTDERSSSGLQAIKQMAEKSGSTIGKEND